MNTLCKNGVFNKITWINNLKKVKNEYKWTAGNINKTVKETRLYDFSQNVWKEQNARVIKTILKTFEV